MSNQNWSTAVSELKRAKKVLVFTGAGISAESGIPTFRDSDGFWQKFPPELFANWQGLFNVAQRDPSSVIEFVFNLVEPVAKALPNAGHLAVAQLEDHVETTVVTQNVDGLHQFAGSKNVLEIHGSLLEVVDTVTGNIVRRFERDELAENAEAMKDYLSNKITLEMLVSGFLQRYPLDWLGKHRPNLVLFGDSLAKNAWGKSWQASADSDVLISVGTSGAVYPAALLPERAAELGATVITIDPQSSSECWLEGRAEVLLPKLVQEAFGGIDSRNS
jgi:NAD-dependent deacetylase